MATHLLLRTSWQFEDTDPKNQAVISPCFRTTWDPTAILGTDAQALVDDWHAVITALTVPATKLITVKAYNLEGTKPNYPLAQKTTPAGSPTPLQGVPQQAVCLSFYGDVNQPRKRGRLYLPAWALTTSTAELASARISSTVRTKAGTLVSGAAGLGGANVDWIVWSRVAHSASRVTNYFVDESWDIQRRRKLKSLARTTGTTSG